MLIIPDEGDIAKVLGRHIDALIMKHKGICKDIEDPRIAGILFHVATPSYVESSSYSRLHNPQPCITSLRNLTERFFGGWLRR